MTRRSAASMPDSLRSPLRGRRHPARSVPCPHCGAAAYQPCVVRSRDRVLPQPHPVRVSVWAQTVACCPECQVEPTAPCHDDGRVLATVHARRYQEAEAAA